MEKIFSCYYCHYLYPHNGADCLSVLFVSSDHYSRRQCQRWVLHEKVIAPIFFSSQLVACKCQKYRTTVGHYLACSPVPSFFVFLPSRLQKLTSTLTLASFFSTNAESAIKLGYMFADWIPCVHLVFIHWFSFEDYSLAGYREKHFWFYVRISALFVAVLLFVHHGVLPLPSLQLHTLCKHKTVLF